MRRGSCRIVRRAGGACRAHRRSKLARPGCTLQGTDWLLGCLQDAAEDYTRILAELQQLEAAAGAAGRSAVGGGAASAAEAGEGAGVEDLE